MGDLSKMDKDMTVTEVRKLGVIEGDGVHLTLRVNQVAAVSLCHRVKERLVEMYDQRMTTMEEGTKRRRML
jgi:hypothetical protein